MAGAQKLKRFEFKDSKGISSIFLVIAMLLMVMMGYVFSYLIPSKQKSVVFPIQSTQAFFIAQSGVEYAVRYAADQVWTTPATLAGLNAAGVNQRNLGAGRFTITYVNVDPTLDTLISVGEAPVGTERRTVSVSNFTMFLGTRILVLSSPAPCVERNQHDYVDFYITSAGTLPVDLNSFSGTWQRRPNRHIDQVILGGTLKFNGGYNSRGARTYFNRNPNSPPNSIYTLDPGDTIRVQLNFSGDIRGVRNFTFTFYDTLGNPYSFLLQGSTGMGECPP